MDVSRYLVELRRPDEGWTELRAAADEARRAAAELRADGVPVRFLRSVYVPEDDACFFLFEGPSAADVAKASSRAGIVGTTVEAVRARRIDVDGEGGRNA